MAIPGIDPAHPAAGAKPQPPAEARAGDLPAGAARARGFALALRAEDTRVTGPTRRDPDGAEARRGTRATTVDGPPAEIASSAREIAEAALAHSVSVGRTLQTVIEAAVQKTIDDGLAGAEAGAVDELRANLQRLARQAAEETDWEGPAG